MEKKMVKRRLISSQTKKNWSIDVVLFLGAVVSSFTGIYFLIFPVGGYQGGRNPMYGIMLLFNRETWGDLHTWFGIGMILAALIHIVIHWKWIVNMTIRAFREITAKERRMNRRSRFNVGINMLIGLGFLITALSGVYLLFVPGGRYGIADPYFLFGRNTWDLIHTWAGIVMIDAAIIHFVIHWGWVVKVTGKLFQSLKPQPLRYQNVKETPGMRSG
jgi:hypothetical protein